MKAPWEATEGIAEGASQGGEGGQIVSNCARF